jgi:hypothetical protein
VATYGTDAGAKKLKLYVDGLLKGELPGPSDPPVNYIPAQPTGPNQPPFRVGAGRKESDPTNITPDQFFKGRIDEVALYNKALDAATVKTHFDKATTK